MNAPLATQFDQYVSFCIHTKRLRTPTIKGYEDVFKQFKNLMPEITHADQVTSETIDAFFVRLHQRTRQIGNGREVTGIKGSTARTYGSKLRSFFQWLCARGYIQKNPIAAVKLAKAEYNDKRALKREEIEKILAAITQHSPNRFLLKRDLAMVHVLLFAGLRRTELLSLKVSDVDTVRRIITVQGATSKSKVTRHVPITAATEMHIEDYLYERRNLRRQSEYLWTSSKSDTPLTTHGLKHWVDTLRLRSGVRFHVHRFRHTFACMLGRTNVSTIKIQKLMGHTDLRMTQTYMRSLGTEDVRDSVHHLSLDSLAGL